MRFQLKQYGTEAVAFDTVSGDTHYLAPLALQIFQLCRDHPGLSRAEVRALLAERHSGVRGSALEIQVDETLGGLSRIGLIHIDE